MTQGNVQIYSIGDIKQELQTLSRLFESQDTLGGINSRHIQALESKFEKLIDKKATFTDSCTNGIYLVLKKLQLKNEYVILPPITFFGLAGVVLKAGGIPLYSRVNKYGLMDLDSVKELCETYKVRAIIPSHINNQYVPTEDLTVDSVVIEDAAPAYGIKRKDGSCVLANTSNISVISFSYGKPLTAGEGGMILSNDSLEWHKGQRYCGLHINGVYGYGTTDVFEPELKMSNNSISAALVMLKLKSFANHMSKAYEVAKYYNSQFGSLVDSELNHSGNHQTFVILSSRRDKIMENLNSVGVKSYLSHRPLYRNTAYSDFAGAENFKESTESYFSKILHIPCRYDLSDNQVSLISETVKNTL